MRSVIAFFLLCILIIRPCKSQELEPKFQRFTLDQGLSMNFITCINQDKQGFIWVGTADGLNKYDGYKFTVYRNNPKIIGSISNSFIITIYEDKQGVLYVGTDDGGLNIYDRERDRFIAYRNDPENSKSINSNRVNTIFEDSKGNLWIGTEKGLDLFNRKSETFTHYVHEADNNNSITYNMVRALIEERNGNLWIGTEMGISVLSPDRKTFHHYHHEQDNPNSISVNPVRTFFIDSEERLWIGTAFGGINLFDKTTQHFINYRNDGNEPNSPIGDYVPGICEDKEGRLWCATNFGIAIWNQKTNAFTNYQRDAYDNNSLVDNGLNTIFKDRDGNIWIGSIAGLSMKEMLPPKFQHIVQNPGKPESPGSKEIFCFYEDQQSRIWIGLRSGFDLFNRETDTFKHYKNFSDGKPIPTVTSIYEDKNGILWLGMYEGLARYDIEKGTYQIFSTCDPQNPASTRMRDVWYMREDAKGDLYISSFLKSVFRYVREENRFDLLIWRDKDIHLIDPTTFYIDKENNFWLGSARDGLVMFNQEKGTYHKFMHQTNIPNSISNNYILTIYEDRKNNFWVGTRGGLNLLDRKTNTFLCYREKDGLPNDQINAIQEDKKGRLWLSTNDGLSNFDPEAKTFKNFDSDDGLQHDEFWHRVSYKLRNGEMLFGGLNGFNIVNPDRILFNSVIPPVYITDFQIFNKPVPIDAPNSPLQKSITQTKELTLSYKQSVFSFDFVALNYVISKKNQYAFKMEGFDKDWNYVGTQHKATYTNLDPGKYTFRVKASNNDGVWNETGTSLTIIITPPFWKTWWFIVVCTILGIAIFYLFFWMKTNQITQENKKLEARVFERTQKIELQKQEIVNRSEELKQLNLEISNQNEILERKVEERTQDLQAINEELAANEEELRQTLDHTIDINNKLIESQEQLEEQNEELRRINTELDRFVYSASHDLRAPLSSLLGLITIAKMESQDDVKENYLSMMEKSINKLDTFIRSIISYSKNTRLEVSVEPIDFREFFDDAFDNLKYMDRSEVIEKKLILKGDAPFHSDAFRLKIIFNNIISNNIRYSNPHVESFIHVYISTDQHNAYIEFKDNGCGIAEERVDKVFEMFYRASELNVGSGLGLYIVKEVVRALGGTIKVSSTLGEGTSFNVQLPNLKTN